MPLGAPTPKAADLCPEEGFGSTTFDKWRATFGGMEASEDKRLPAPIGHDDNERQNQPQLHNLQFRVRRRNRTEARRTTMQDKKRPS